MSDGEWQRHEVDSPCIRVCVIHPSAGICAGCYRTVEEIAAWGGMEDADRLALKEALPERAGLLKRRRGGRAGRMREG